MAGRCRTRKKSPSATACVWCYGAAVRMVQKVGLKQTSAGAAQGHTWGRSAPPGAVRPLPDIWAVAQTGPLAGLLAVTLLGEADQHWSRPGPHTEAQRAARSCPACA